MSTSIIDGTIEEATFKRAFVKMQVWGLLVFRLRDGSTRTLDKVIIESSLAPYITPGNSGRFYCYAAIDHRGIHGVRTDQGEAHYAFARNNEIVSLISAGSARFSSQSLSPFMDMDHRMGLHMSDHRRAGLFSLSGNASEGREAVRRGFGLRAGSGRGAGAMRRAGLARPPGPAAADGRGRARPGRSPPSRRSRPR